LAAATAQAQGSFPNKPIHIVVGFAAGGATTSYSARGRAQDVRRTGPADHRREQVRRAEHHRREYVAKSAPDGYTLFMGPSGAMTMNPAILLETALLALKDFAQISMIGDFP